MGLFLLRRRLFVGGGGLLRVVFVVIGRVIYIFSRLHRAWLCVCVEMTVGPDSWENGFLYLFLISLFLFLFTFAPFGSCEEATATG